MKVNDFEMLLIDVTFYLYQVWKRVFSVLIKKEKQNIIGTVVIGLTLMLPFFQTIFRHLKLELLTQFPVSNDEKYLYLCKNRCLQNVIFRLTKHLSQNILGIRVVFIGLKFNWKRIYSVPAAWGLTAVCLYV